jgi:hypothetical protein
MKMDEGAKGWLYKTACTNWWRVASYMELDDLIQEGYACYYYLHNHYKDVHDAPHIMSLFKVAFVNVIHDLSKGTRSSGVGSWVCWTDTYGDSSAVDQVPAEVDDIADLISEAPPVLASALKALLASGEKLAAPYLRRNDGTRETFNDRLCSIAGLNPKSINLHRMLLDYLKLGVIG